MKLNLPRLVLTAGLSLGIISVASVAEAGITRKQVVMSKQQPEKFAAGVTPETTRHDKTLVRVEEELTEKLLEAIAGRSAGGGWGGNHNESLVRTKQVIVSQPQPEKPRPQQPCVQLEGKLTQAQLEAIAGGGSSTTHNNHNETMVSITELNS